MKISFHGAAQSVTGSKHMISLTNGSKYLLDCGMFQGMGKETEELNRNWGFEPSELTHMFLSHAHIDHCGLVPKLVKDGFRGNIFCTPATRALASILLEDSAKIQEEDAKFLNKRRAYQGKTLITPLYNREDAQAAMSCFVEVDYGSWYQVNDEIELLLTDAGHIIGSAAVHLKINENGKQRQLTFSGDVGAYRDMILRSPQTFPQADFILIESTYGSSLHDVHHTTPDSLLEWIQKTCIQNRGKLIIPAFSVGRTQEVLYTFNQLELEKRLPPIDVYVDSPLSVKATEVVKSYTEDFNSKIQKVLLSDHDPFKFKGLKYINTVEESKMLNYKKEPCVIISASGMADAGRVKHHISNTIENSHNSILFTGYCEPSSLGGKLLAGAKEVGIHGVSHEVHASIGNIRSMSAHGDYEDLFQFLACQDPKKVQKLFLVHGELEVQEQFKNRLLKKGFPEVEIPARHSVFGLG